MNEPSVWRVSGSYLAPLRAVESLAEPRHLGGDLRGFGGDDGAHKVAGERVGVGAEAGEDGVHHVPEVLVPADRR